MSGTIMAPTCRPKAPSGAMTKPDLRGSDPLLLNAPPLTTG